MNTNSDNHRSILQGIARRVMLEQGLLPDYSPEALAELGRIQRPARESGDAIKDLRSLLWASIDNDSSRDLDQLSVAGAASANGDTRILVAVADVDALVKTGSALDEHASHNTTTVYTPAEIFSMFPEKLSTDLTSLNGGEDRLSIVIDMQIGADGSVGSSEVYRALVHNYAKLTYNEVGAWLDGRGSLPAAVAAVPGLAENLRTQDRVAQSLKNYRHVHGALSLETVETNPKFDGDMISDLEIQQKNRATELIENLMVAANGITARYLTGKQFPSLRRVVRTPKRWDRIVEVAAEHRYTLPAEPDSKALEEFLVKARADDPVHFPDLSLAVIKLMGPGEYVADMPGDSVPGHFGLAVKDYDHSTAPNRRYPDVVTQRLLKSAIGGKPVPYSKDALVQLAQHCTLEEDAAKKVERQVEKSAAALMLQSRIGGQFDAIVTGAADKGTWVRLLTMPVEGKLVQGFAGADVGHHLRVQLVSVDVQKGFIDFKKVD
ncbi:MAG TPA: RNB domain-containing ribonuclease [Anaerolineales bacterium]|nr:RNB domain-containing ribonuclease [Anaerolineales bacterium]